MQCLGAFSVGASMTFHTARKQCLHASIPQYPYQFHCRSLANSYDYVRSLQPIYISHKRPAMIAFIHFFFLFLLTLLYVSAGPVPQATFEIQKPLSKPSRARANFSLKHGGAVTGLKVTVGLNFTSHSSLDRPSQYVEIPLRKRLSPRKFSLHGSGDV